MRTTIRVFVADRHPIVRKGVQALIVGEPDLELVGEADKGDDFVRKSRLLRPDVAVVDLQLPGMDVFAALHQLTKEQPSPRILILTDEIQDERAVAIIKAGALGYLSKESPLDQVLQAIRDVALGRSPLDPFVAQRLICELKHPSDPPSVDFPLSTREIEVLVLVGQGLTNREIAAALVVSERTVGNHISTILGKLHIGNRTQAALYALREGLTILPEQIISPVHRNGTTASFVRKQYP